jgi:pimeloyl-ACP methyl ester carboxylesterase
MSVSFEEKTMERKGCVLHYWVSKKDGAPWIVLLHGAGADHRSFDAQYPILAGKYNLIAMDSRGAGQSRPFGDELTAGAMVDDTLTVLDSEGIRRAAFIGHSLGGNITQEIAYRSPERVACAVFIDCTCNTMRLTSLERFAVKSAPAIFALYPEKTLVRLSAEASAVKPEVRRYLEEVLGSVGKQGFTRIMVAGAVGFLHSDEEYRFAKPMLLICGEHDGTGNIRKCAPKWAAREPQCEFHWLKGAGHCSNMDEPEAFNALLADFLQRKYPVK